MTKQWALKKIIEYKNNGKQLKKKRKTIDSGFSTVSP